MKFQGNENCVVRIQIVKDFKVERFVTVLEIPPVDPPQTAVKMAIYSDIKKGRK